MRFPKFLPDNGRIGFIAPSMGCATGYYRAAFDAALDTLKSEGYTTVLGPNCYVEEGVGKSNTAEKCAAEINDFFLNDRSDIILCCGGGETMCEDLPFVDFKAISKADPKWYMGYSDNTNLTFLLPLLADTAAIYGPAAKAFGMNPRHEAIEDAWELLKGKKLTVSNYDGWEMSDEHYEDCPRAPYNITEEFKLQSFLGRVQKEDQSFSGRLMGGCLDCLVNICGTSFDKVKAFNEKYKEDGIIWFLEACDLNVMGMRRAFWQLKNAGWFDSARGFLIGRPVHYAEDIMGLDRTEAVLSMLAEFELPIITDLDIGHMNPMMPLVEGAMAQVSVMNGGIDINMMLR